MVGVYVCPKCVILFLVEKVNEEGNGQTDASKKHQSGNFILLFSDRV